MAEDRPISGYAQRFVERKLEQIERQAYQGADWYHEFAENFSNGVDELAGKAKRRDLREYVLSEAKKTGNYVGQEPAHGRWEHDAKVGAPRWNGDTPDSWKQVDFQGQWVSKSADESARYVVGHFGEDRRTQNDYPGVQVEKNGVVGSVRWGPEQPTAQDAQEYAEGMLDKHLGFNAPKLAPSSHKDIRKAGAMSERLGAKVLTSAYRKYIKDSAKVTATKINPVTHDDFKGSGIRELVWEGPYVETGRGHLVRGFAGQTETGTYKAAQGLVADISGPEGGKHYGVEIYSWSKETYAQPDHAIAKAHEWVAESMEMFRGQKETVRRRCQAGRRGSEIRSGA